MLKINTIVIFYFLLVSTAFAGINGCYNENGAVYFTDKPCKKGDVKKQYNERTGYELKATRQVKADVNGLTSTELEKAFTAQSDATTEASEKKEDEALDRTFQESKRRLAQHKAELAAIKAEITADPDIGAAEKAKLIAAANAKHTKQKTEISAKAKSAYQARVKSLKKSLKKATAKHEAAKQKASNIQAEQAEDNANARRRINAITGY